MVLDFVFIGGCSTDLSNHKRDIQHWTRKKKKKDNSDVFSFGFCAGKCLYVHNLKMFL